MKASEAATSCSVAEKTDQCLGIHSGQRLLGVLGTGSHGGGRQTPLQADQVRETTAACSGHRIRRHHRGLGLRRPLYALYPPFGLGSPWSLFRCGL